MNYLSLFSGIEAATQAWHPLGWKPVGFSEIEPFPCAVLAHHYPHVKNYGDVTQYKKWGIKPGSVDVLVGGSPCQSFSVAGLRKGLDDPRGNLMLTYLGVAKLLEPRFVLWENVLGVLSSNGGRDFGTFLRGLEECGYGWAYRVIDAQFTRTRGFPRAVPQRRRRVFVVGCLGDWRRAAAVLFDRESLQWNPAPRRESREGVTGNAGSRAKSCSQIETYRWQNQEQGIVNDDCAAALKAKGTTTDERSVGSYAVMATGQRGAGLVKTFDRQSFGEYGTVPVASTVSARDYKSASDLIATQVMAMRESGQGYWMEDDVTGTLRAEGENRPSRPSNVVAFGAQNSAHQGDKVSVEYCPTLDKSKTPGIAAYRQVRRLTPIECERLMGFPDNFTRIPWRNKPAEQCPDGPRYKALGNSMAVNCMEHLGRRIQLVAGPSKL